MYDYLVVGSGLFGATFAHEMTTRGKSVLVLESRDHTGGNVYCEEREGIRIHKYGAHIFHTSDREVWEYASRFVEFNNYVNSPVANYRGELYNMPFNMNTFNKLWGVVTPAEAQAKIEAGRAVIKAQPQNLEEQAISLVGIDIYEKLIRGYTEKQWGRKCKDLPAFIIKRLPVRYTFDNNYFNDRYQGIPMGGYNKLIDALLEGSEIKTGANYNLEREKYGGIARKVIYSGPIDEYFDYRLGELAYRGLRFETKRFPEANRQGVAVMNYTAEEVPYTRSIEHKHFEFGAGDVTYVTLEYPADWHRGEDAYYPVNDVRNQALYQDYAALAAKEKNVRFGGRLAEYKYYDMDDVIKRALEMARAENF